VGQGKQERLHPGTPTFGHSFEDYQEDESQESLTTPDNAQQAQPPEK
jgi:hypothetical protein